MRKLLLILSFGISSCGNAQFNIPLLGRGTIQVGETYAQQVSRQYIALNNLSGQRLQLEIGWNYLTGSNTATNGTCSLGSSAATDLVTDNTTTAANNPHIDFSVTPKEYRRMFF